MKGIAFSGGGLRGSYQIGVYWAFKKCRIKIDGFVGTSIGAFNAAMLACGREKELLSFWQNVDAGKILGFTEGLSKEVNENELDFDFLKELAINVKNVLVNKGISTKGLKEVLNHYKLDKCLYKSKKDFGLVTVKFKDFEPVYMFKEDIVPEKLNDYILGSCYLPIFKMEKIIDDNYYLDGGFHDNVPANALLNRGYDMVYAVDLKAPGIKRPYQDKKKVIVIRPSRNLGSILNINKLDINNNIKLGYYDALKILKKLDGNHYLFKVRSKWYYEMLIRKVSDGIKEEMYKFFRTNDAKRLILKALEYVMNRESYSYFAVYDSKKVIKNIKEIDKNYGVYKFIKKLNFI